MVDDVGGRLDPLAGVVDAAIGADRADERFRRDTYVRGLLDDRFESEANGGATLFEKAGGAGVSVNRGVVVETVVVGDVFWAAPAEKLQFDRFALGVVAHGAFARVAPKRGFDLRLRPVALFVFTPRLLFSESAAHASVPF